KELLNENNGDELAAMRKRKQHCQRSANSLTHNTWVCEKSAWHGMMDENSGKSMRDILPKVFKPLNAIPQDLGYKPHTFLGEVISLSGQKQLKKIV
ncbi:hypothetical protein ACTXT7_002074, partial [Hymenolepis weldensis]